MDWMGFPLLYLDWIANIQIEEGSFQKIFCLILSNLNSYQLHLLYWVFNNFEFAVYLNLPIDADN